MSTPTNKDFENFGREVWGRLKDWYPDCPDEMDEELMEQAGKFGLARRVVYDPTRHGECDVEPGCEMWWWGEEARKLTAQNSETDSIP